MKKLIVFGVGLLLVIGGITAYNVNDNQVKQAAVDTAYYQSQVSYYDQLSRQEEAASQKDFNDAQFYSRSASRSAASLINYNELIRSSQLHHEKAVEYNRMANTYRLELTR